jgi:hypothetical protein
VIPPALLQDYQKLLSSAPTRRLNPSKVAESKFLNNKLVGLVAFMESIAGGVCAGAVLEGVLGCVLRGQAQLWCLSGRGSEAIVPLVYPWCVGATEWRAQECGIWRRLLLAQQLDHIMCHTSSISTPFAMQRNARQHLPSHHMAPA